MTAESNYEDGRRDARLDAHDAALKDIHAETILIVNLVSTLDKQIQRQGDAAAAAAEATIKLAEAVNAEKENAARALALVATTASSKWTKRDSLVSGLLAAVVTIATVWIAVHH